MSIREIHPSDASESSRGLVRALLAQVGLARGDDTHDFLAGFEALENRILLGGDHPSFVDVFPPGTQMPTLVDVSGGSANVAGMHEQAGDDDMFRFTAPDDDFVTIWADSLNSGLNLDTELRIYDPASATPTIPIFTGTNNGTLKDGLYTDAWIGFVADAGTEYYVQVLGETAAAGDYTLRIDVETTDLATGADPIEFNGVGQINMLGADEVFILQTPDDDTFDSVTTANATTLNDGANFDSRIEVYDSEGNLLVQDSETGRLTMALGIFASDPDSTYYLRVRSDFAPSAPATATGDFTLRVDAQPTVVNIDDTNRRGSAGGLFGTASATQMFTFTAQGTGLMIATAAGTGLIPLADPTLLIYDSEGNQLGVADDVVGLNPQMEINLVGGEQYFMLLWGVDLNGPGEWVWFLEAHTTHTNQIPIDDHADIGDFEMATPIRLSDPMNHPDIPPTDHLRIQTGFGSGRIHAGGDTDLFMFTAPWSMLGDFEGFGTEGDDMAFPPIEEDWYDLSAPSERLQLILAGSFGAFNNMFVEVFDSQFNSLYQNDTIAPPFPDPAGMLDPSTTVGPLSGADLEAAGFAGIEIWGGETYYIAVSAGGTGRYDFQVTTTAFDESQVTDTGDPAQTEITDAGDFSNARQIVVNGSSAGDATNFIANMQFVGSPNASFWRTGPDGPDPADPNDPPADPMYPMGLDLIQFYNYAAIEAPDDTDLYFFTAPATGTAEIWINTTNITDETFEIHLDPANPFDPIVATFGPETKTISSRLDSTLKIYNNNTELVLTADDNGAMQGESLTTNVGTLGQRTFFQRDARAVIPVVAGNRYYIEVGGAEAGASSDTTNLRSGIGKYELLINTMPDLNFDDDHANFALIGADSFATVIPFDDAAGTATVTGEIENTFNNPADIDFFEFWTPGTGTLDITVSADPGETVLPDITFFDATGTILGTAAATSDGIADFQVSVNRGERYFVAIEGAGASEGAYTINISGIPLVDDHADLFDWENATVVTTLDFSGTGSASGSIEVQNDTDLFVFTATGFDFMTANVSKVSTSFNPFVSVYEVHEDTNGDPVYLQISFNDDISGTDTDSQAFFSVTPDHMYYVVVSGSDPNIDRGDYNLDLIFTPTDDHADLGEESNATFVVVTPATGQGTGTGMLEDSDDDDLFTFESPGTGTGTVLVSGFDDLNPSVEVFDSDGNSIAMDVSPVFFNFVTVNFPVQRGQVYFVNVDGNTAGVDFGGYSVDFTAPPVDDHANSGDFALATTIVLGAVTGQGSTTGQMGVGSLLTFQDTDLFKFLTLVDGTVEVTIGATDFTPTLTIFDSSETQIVMSIDGDANDEDGSTDGSVTVSFDTSENDIFFIEVGADGIFVPGSPYTVDVVGPVPAGGGGGPDDFADAGDFDNAGGITLDPNDGNGDVAGNIEEPGDTDLFTFTSLALGRAFVQVITAPGSVLDVSLRIFDHNRQEVPGTFNAAGVPGINALADFDVTQAGQPYYVEVGGLGTGTGTYEVRVDTPLASYRLVYPEGFGGPNIREFVSIANPNDFAVAFTVTLNYENESLDPLVLNATDLPDGGILDAGARGGVTLSNGEKGTIDGLVENEPYSIVIHSTGPLGATLSHYDFGLALGEAFTRDVSVVWSFARAERNPGAVNDFIVFHNPNDHEVTVTLTVFLQSNFQITLTRNVEANRRGGFNLDAETSLPVGTFAAVLTSAPADVADASDHIGIVAALSHYDTATQAGYAVLGDPSSGTTEGVVPSLTNGNEVTGEVRIFNPGSSAATVNITASYLNLAVADVTLPPMVVSPRSFIVLDGASLQLISDQPAGLRFNSDSPVTILATEERNGDANATPAATEVGMTFFFGDAFVNTLLAGTSYFENLNIYNPAPIDINVQITFFFTTGQSKNTTVNVGSDGFGTVALHELTEVIENVGLNFFSMEVSSSDGPFALTMDHYDLFLGGGWGTNGAPLGLTNSLAEI